MEKNIILEGNCLDSLKTLPDESINCCITSPPYYGLRDYGTGTWVGGDPNCKHYRKSKMTENSNTGHKKMALEDAPVGDGIYKSVCKLCGAVRTDSQVGLEETPEEYIARLVDIFKEVKRCLTPDGVCWINIGDTYNVVSYHKDETSTGVQGYKQATNKGSYEGGVSRVGAKNCKPKDLIGIPWMLAFALRNDGWYLRQDIIWAKPNPMPEPVKDRCVKSHEYIFLLSKSSHYYFDYEAIQEPCSYVDGHTFHRYNLELGNEERNIVHAEYSQRVMRNKRDVWSVIPAHYKEAHFATFPEELVYPMLIAGCPKDGIVLDPFMGSGTVAVVAKKNHRNYIGCELNPDYIKMANNRIKTTAKKLF